MIPADVLWVHVEASSRCNAWCPGCPRNNRGFELASGFTPTDLDLNRYVQVLDQLPALQGVQFCGNLGDPLSSNQLTDMIDYCVIRKLKVQIHTNGSLRNIAWWQELAMQLKGASHEVWFGIDGLEGVHEAYRQGTSYSKIIENASAFIDAGGTAVWQFIPFAHNEHQLKECMRECYRIGFKRFEVAHLHRKPYVARDYRTGEEYDMLPPTLPVFKKVTNQDLVYSAAPAAANKERCMHLTMPSIYLAATGQLSLCCYRSSEEHSDLHSLFEQDVDLSHDICRHSCR